MPERERLERLERPQASLMETIEEEMAEESRLESMDNSKLLMWKKRHAKVTISILYIYIIGFVISGLVMIVSPELGSIILALTFILTIIPSVWSLWIAVTNPSIFKIKMDGTFHLTNAYWFNFIWLFLEIGFPTVALILAIILAAIYGIATLF